MPDDSLLRWLERLAAAFDRADLRYAVAGGLAVAAWAEPRATVDIDLVVASDADTIERARATCARAGLAQTKRRVVQFKRVGLLRMIATEDTGPEPIAIDLLLLPEGLEHEMLARARRLPLGAVDVDVVSPEDLILLKLLRFSDQDRIDARAVARARTLDRRYLERQARALRLLGRLRRVV